jgi:hypothetical protein
VDEDSEDGSEGGGEDVDEDNDGSITNTMTFSFSSLLLSPEDSHGDSISVSHNVSFVSLLLLVIFFILDILLLV